VCVCVCVCVCGVCVCVRACVRACVRLCVQKYTCARMARACAPPALPCTLALLLNHHLRPALLPAAHALRGAGDEFPQPGKPLHSFPRTPGLHTLSKGGGGVTPSSGVSASVSPKSSDCL
jgi:hypothetical protein